MNWTGGEHLLRCTIWFVEIIEMQIMTIVKVLPSLDWRIMIIGYLLLVMGVISDSLR